MCIRDSLYAPSSSINITGGEGVIVEGNGDLGVIIKAAGLGDLMIRHDNVDGYVKINANGINGEARIYGKAGARLTSDGAVIIAGTTGVLIVGLPTTNPGVTDQLWNDGGTVKIA